MTLTFSQAVDSSACRHRDIARKRHNLTGKTYTLQEVAAAEAKKEQLDLRTRGLGQEKDRLQAHLEGLQAGIKEAEATAEATTKDLDALVDKVQP